MTHAGFDNFTVLPYALDGDYSVNFKQFTACTLLNPRHGGWNECRGKRDLNPKFGNYAEYKERTLPSNTCAPFGVFETLQSGFADLYSINAAAARQAILKLSTRTSDSSD